MAKLEDVFGVRKEPIKTYLSRAHVDDKFADALKTDRQVIVYGSSKQGKTSLVEKHVPYENNIIVRCTPKAKVSDLYKSIIRQAGAEILDEREVEQKIGTEVSIVTKIKAKLPFVGSAEMEGSGKVETEKSRTKKYKTIEFNLELAQDISEILQAVKNQKVIILENFHYLDDDMQKQLSFDLRTFQELSIRFIIVGVWREKNRLIQFNGDLLDRIIEVPVEPWYEKEFKQVLETGERELCFYFTTPVTNKIIENAFDSIGVVQELAKTLCQLEGIIETRKEIYEIANEDSLNKAIRQKADEYTARHIPILENIAKGQKTTKIREGEPIPLFLPYYLIRVVLTVPFEDVIKGMSRTLIEDEIKKIHHRADDVRPGDMSNLLHGLSKMQSEKGITPPIFDYDTANKQLRIIDSTFYFFLRNSDKSAIMAALPNPLEAIKTGGGRR